MSSTTIGRGNIQKDLLAALQLVPASVTTVTVATQTFPCPGLLVGDHCDVRFQGAMIFGIIVSNAWCAAPDVLSIQFYNSTAGGVVPSPGTYVINVNRAENGFTSLPNNVL